MVQNLSFILKAVVIHIEISSRVIAQSDCTSKIYSEIMRNGEK